MSDVDRYFHETWLGMVQPVDGLVVSIPVLVDAQCMERQPPHVQQKLVDLCPPTRKGEAGPEGYTIATLQGLFSGLLGFTPDSFDALVDEEHRAARDLHPVGQRVPHPVHAGERR